MPGLSYRMQVDLQTPRIVHALRFSPGAPGLRAKTEVAAGRVFGIAEGRGREETSAIVKRSKAIAGVNGDFFPFTGDPLGAMVRDGELISRPEPRRAVFGWGPVASSVGKLKWSAKLTSNGVSIPIDGLNEECGENMAVLNTTGAAVALAKPPCIYAVLRVGDVRWSPTGRVLGTLEIFDTDKASLPIEPGTAVLAVRGAKGAQLTKIARGQSVEIEMQTSGMDWSKIDNVIGGGPFLLRDSQTLIDWQASGFNAGFANNRHPRTAIGRTAAGEIWLVAIDGRQTMSVGATLQETAEIMRSLGCVDAVNLDGGGSTTIAVFQVVLNRPSDGSERKVSNGVVILGPDSRMSAEEMVFQGPARLTVGSAASYRVIGSDGKPILDSEVLWSASGGAWVDQGGTLRTTKEGSATLRASVRGRLLSIDVKIEPAPNGSSAAPPRR